MAFHVACPITCRKICFCELGFPRSLQSENARSEFMEEVAMVERFIKDPWLIKGRQKATVQVKVPKVVVATAPPPPPPVPLVDEVAAAASAQVKRAALQKQAAAASVVAEDYAKRFESGDLLTSVEDTAGEEHGLSNSKIMCRLCFRGDNEGSERARKMLPCNSCGKKYHRSCLKSWSQNRDLFHWSSWTCPSCRTCEVCRRTGDPNKFMFCKRCDAAHHCYCQQPPHKNVGHGPYLCPKHTKCHSCASSVPGNGLSVRWFLGYTCCDACGRLFVKNNYCPVCLKVYRDSESTPMVCCDICEKWVHCPCDGISDAKYQQFQVDGNLQYVCPTCRGECRQVKTMEEAVQELWKRRDEADKDLIASLRAAAGLPTQEEIFDISPFSDDDEVAPVVKNEYGRSLKFSLKGAGDSSPRKNKDYGKKSSSKRSGKKKGNGASLFSKKGDGSSFGYTTGGYKNEEMQISGEFDTISPIAGRSLTEGVCSVNEAGVSKHKYVEEITAGNGNKAPRTIKIRSAKPHGLSIDEGIGTQSSLPKTAQGPKLVIHLGGRHKNTAAPPKFEGSSLRKGQDLASSNGEPEDGYESNSPKNMHSLHGKRRAEDIRSGMPVGKRSRYPTMKLTDDRTASSGDLIDDKGNNEFISQAPEKDRKPYLKFKIPKNSSNGSQSAPSNSKIENHNLMPLPGKDEITYTRGQRSKRRRSGVGDEETSQWGEDNTIKDFTDANWILQKLGKDAAGKRVEVHHTSDNSWHRGTVLEVLEGTMVSIALDEGKAKNFELGKQGIRFVSQKR